MLEFDCGLEFNPSHDADFFSALPPFPAICLIEGHDPKAEPYLIKTQDLRRRLQRLLGPLDPASKRLNLRDFAKTVRYRVTASAFEQSLAYYEHAKQLFPKKYRAMMRLRPPAVLKVNLRNAYPRCYATRRIPVDSAGAPTGGSYYGPFASRKAADAFAEIVLDLFKVRRCQIKIRRDPAYPGCIYSEMKMCLAPCFAGCSKEEYDVEVHRLVQFLETNGSSLRAEYEASRDKASEDLDFERASAFHKRLDKVDEALRGQPELPRRIQDLNLVILQRASADQTVAVFPAFSGRLAEPFFLSFSELAGEPRSLEQLLRDRLESADSSNRVIPRSEAKGNLLFSDAATDDTTPDPSATNIVIPSEVHEARTASSPSGFREENLLFPSDVAFLPGDLTEHLFLISRWFYSNPRQGEIFFREKSWPYRRMMRACARLLAPPEPEPPAAKENSTGDVPRS